SFIVIFIFFEAKDGIRDFHVTGVQTCALPILQFKQYEKISFALSNLSEKFKNRKIFKNYQFLFKEQDSTKMGGQIMLPAYMEERSEERRVGKEWKSKRRIEYEEKKDRESLKET